MFAVPRGARISVAVSNARGYTLEGIDVMPKQEQAVDAEPDDDPDPETFADEAVQDRRRAYRGSGTVPARLAYARTFG